MCGIVGYTGAEAAVPIVLDGLRRLEYRGYDSAGLAVLHDGALTVHRRVGKLAQLEQALAGNGLVGTAGIGHTRWATHGKPTEANAHPHRSGSVVVVHNGIVENYAILKNRLRDEGYRFQSETDTEVIAHLLASYLRLGHALVDALGLVLQELRGSYAVVAMAATEPGTLVAARQGCPLVLGQGDGAAWIGSDVTALLRYTREVRYLNDGDCAVVSPEGIEIRDVGNTRVHRSTVQVDWSVEAAAKGGYPHFMLKEIAEQPRVLLDTVRGRCGTEAGGSGQVELADLGLSPDQLRAVRRLWIVACGSSWHAALVGKYVLETLGPTPVQVDLGSEFRYRDPLVQPDDLVVAISQSGETADTLAAAREAQRRGARVLGIVNVVGSTLAREADGVLYTRCGPEISVASTKAFTGQLTALYLLALYLGSLHARVKPEDMCQWIEHLLAIPGAMEHILKREAELIAIAKRYASKRNFLYLGRGINYPIALEGALKLKEISYIHAEGYAAGEMKHGPIALVDKDMPVVVLVPRDQLYDKTVNNLMEVKARNAPVIAFVSEGERELGRAADAVFTIPDVPPLLTPFLYTTALQLMAYHIAAMRGLDVDHPRNLAKSVTVE